MLIYSNTNNTHIMGKGDFMRINPIIFKNRRLELRLTLDELSASSRVHKATIHRIELGKQEKTRKLTVEALSKALRIDAEELTKAEADDGGVVSILEMGRSKMTLRVTNKVRNAAMLVAKRYGVSVTEVFEFAPLLFYITAEESLQLRTERLSRLTDARQLISDVGSEYSHIAPRIGNDSQAEDMEGLEEKSIRQNDIRGRLLDSHDDFFDIRPHDYDDEEQNAFIGFLKAKLAAMDRNGTEFGVVTGWGHRVSPDFTICKREAATYFGGDEDVADDAIEGQFALHELPRELRADEQLDARVSWAKSKIEENRAKAAALFDEFEIGGLL
jgi:transcriptional regulator with XRE-family HTH domain